MDFKNASDCGVHRERERRRHNILQSTMAKPRSGVIEKPST
jgi:hypothetical protein